MLEFGSYQTAWAWLHKLRRAMVLPGRELLQDAVEVDETYVGGVRPGTGGRGAAGKAIVVIAVEDRGEAAGRVRMRRVPDVSKATLTDIVLDNVERGSEVHTDGWQGYDDIGKYRFSHVVTNLSASGDPAHVVMPHVHLVASLLKRWLLGTHQGAVHSRPTGLLPRRVHLPLQPAPITPPRPALHRLAQQALAVGPAPYNAIIKPPGSSYFRTTGQ